MIKSWIFEMMNIASDENPAMFDAEVCQQEYSWRLDLWRDAEKLGFHGVFFSEHHFGGARVCPSPMLLAAAAAARTTRLRIGVLGLVLPMWQPWRAIEEIGMLDHLSGGRLEVGVARGSGLRETEAVGVPSADVLPMYNEALDILDKAWRNPTLTHRGRYWSFDDLTILPRPVQRPSPPIWGTVRSVEGAADAARRGYKVCTGFLSTEDINTLFDAYREAAAACGKNVSAEHLAIRRCIFVASNRSDAQDQARVARAQIPSMLEQDCIAGSPADVVEQIRWQLGHTGAGHIVGFFTGNHRDRSSILRSYRLYGADVIPLLQGGNKRLRKLK